MTGNNRENKQLFISYFTFFTLHGKVNVTHVNIFHISSIGKM